MVMDGGPNEYEMASTETENDSYGNKMVSMETYSFFALTSNRAVWGLSQCKE